MSIPVSTVPAAITAIYTATKAQLAAASETAVLLCVGTPMAEEPNDIIQITAAVRRQVSTAAEVGSGGAYWLMEQYDVTVKVSSALVAQSIAQDPLVLVKRAWQLLAYVETAVRTDPSLGNAVLVCYPLSTTGGKPATGTGTTPGRIVTLTAPFHCEALI